MSNTPTSNAKSDAFYVGYLPLPKALAPVVKAIIGLGIAAAIVFAFVLSSAQKDPGPGLWDTSKIYEIEGHLTVSPYPIIHVPDEASPTKTRAVLLVSGSKFGVEDRTKAMHGKRVRAKGEFITHQGRGMFALLDDEDALAVVSDDSTAPQTKELGEHTMVGEICDSKCFLGVMKPGSGKTHRSCAVRCISGGIPPIFVTRDANNEPTVYLMVDHDHHAINEAVLPFVAEPVEAQGSLEMQGDLLVYVVNPNKIARK
ncbi:MAG: hypothetical protein ACI9S9_000232 [Planctomycetota bacterium]|jgi:hypothetical protein